MTANFEKIAFQGALDSGADSTGGPKQVKPKGAILPWTKF